MPRYEIVVRTILEKFVGTVEAETEADAIDVAFQRGLPDDVGGVCHHCTTACGDLADPEVIAVEDRDPYSD